MNFSDKDTKILLTTAISYTNGSPHIGHLYEAVLADFIKRVSLMAGQTDTKLLTGTDEHGKKIQTTAQSQGLEPIELCNKYSKEFEQMNLQLDSSYDYFIRTSDQVHKDLVSNTIGNIMINSDDSTKPIYLGEYSGYYNVREETYVTETQASQTNYLDPITSKPYEIVKEPSYYFVLNNYINEINNTTNTIVPYHFQEEIKTRLEKGLEDLSITRTTFDWGIAFPNQLIDSDKHIVYVWFDALLNYVTGKKILFSDSNNVKPIHLIGKDILWFHSVIYPGILKAGEYDDLMPDKILVHGFVLDKEGKKMSKTLGNVITNQELFNSYPIEAIRYYLITNTILGQDFKFDPDNLTNLYNNVLIKDFGNLFQRINKIAKPLERELNSWLTKSDTMESVKSTQIKTLTIVQNFLTNWDFLEYNNYLGEMISNLNKTLTEKKPWTLEPEQQVIEIGNILINFHSVLCLIYPIIPSKTKTLAKYWGWENKINLTSDINLQFDNTEKPIAFEYIVVKQESIDKNIKTLKNKQVKNKKQINQI